MKIWGERDCKWGEVKGVVQGGWGVDARKLR